MSSSYSFTLPADSVGVTELVLSKSRELGVRVVKCPGESSDRYCRDSKCPGESRDQYCAWLTAPRNTWSHSRRKRRKEKLEAFQPKKFCSDSVPVKDLTCDTQTVCCNEVEMLSYSRSEIIEPNSVSGEISKSCLFHCLMSSRRNEANTVVEFQWIFGSDKDSLNQFCSYISKSVEI